MRQENSPVENEYITKFSRFTMVGGAQGVSGKAHALRTDSSGNLFINQVATGSQRTLISRFLDTSGDGAGGKNATADYSAASAIFSIQPSAGVSYQITRMMIAIGDGTNFNTSGYGAAAALSTGIQVRIQNDSGTLVDLTDGRFVKSNAGWGEHCYDVSHHEFGVGNANEVVLVRWTFAKSGQRVRLVGSNNERLEVVFKDDLTGLINHNFKVNGYIE